MEKKYRIWRTETALWEKLKPIAKEMRRKPTEAENRLWQKLRRHKLQGFKFRHQHNIERFIVDFCCPEIKLVIEVDGPIHQYQMQEDQIRQEFLECQHYKVIRISNNEIKYDLDQVLERIKTHLPVHAQKVAPLRVRRGG